MGFKDVEYNIPERAGIPISRDSIQSHSFRSLESLRVSGVTGVIEHWRKAKQMQLV